MDLGHINQLALSSGGTLYLMAVLVFIGLTVIIDRGLRIRRNVRRGASLVGAVSALRVVDAAELDALRAAARDLPLARLLEVYGTDLAVGDGAQLDAKLDAKLEEAIYLEVPHIDRGLWVLDTVITVAPLLGLFGTIVGMFHAFDVMGNSGGDPTRVTAGVAEALIATACGLAIAMSHLWFFNGMNDGVRQIVHQMETLKRLLLNRRTMVSQEAAGSARSHSRVAA